MARDCEPVNAPTARNASCHDVAVAQAIPPPPVERGAGRQKHEAQGGGRSPQKFGATHFCSRASAGMHKATVDGVAESR